jgi:uncharacterized RDD family membrane protein YckC
MRSLIYLAYWTYFESIGKRILHLKTVGTLGEAIGIREALIESFGKAFLLPIDVVLGWIFTNDKKQRIFNMVSSRCYQGHPQLKYLILGTEIFSSEFNPY